MAAKAKKSAAIPAGFQPPPTYSAGTVDFVAATDMRRVRDVSEARSLYEELLKNHTLRSSTIAQVRNQLEGGRPFDPTQLQEQGQSGATNVNFGDAQADRDKTLMPYWEMVHDVPHAVAVSVDSRSPRSGYWQVAFEECFDEFLKDWGSDYVVDFMNVAYNYVNFGPGIWHWEDSDSPRATAVNTQRLYWPKNARMSPRSWDLCLMVKDVSPSELYLKIKTKQEAKRSEYAGWNLRAVEAAIVYGLYGNSKRDGRDYTRWQDDMVQNDIVLQSRFEPLQLAWLYIRQFDGSIACRVFTRQGGLDDFLFEDDHYRDNWRQNLGAIWYDTGVDSLIHSIKGFGIKNFYYAQLLNRMRSRLVDGATITFAMNLQRSDSSVPDETPPVENYNGANVFPPGLTQMQYYPQLEQGMRVIESLQQNKSENNALYRQQQQTQIENSDTATQANILATMQGQITKATASLYLAQVGENFFTECMRRLRQKGSTDPDAKEFVRRMTDREVPKEVIFDTKIRVQTGASAGNANPIVRTQKLSLGLQLSSRPGWNARYFDEQFVAETYGAQAVGKALLPEGAASMPQQRRQAMMENSMFGQGMPLPVDPGDAHAEHADEHLKPMEAMLAAIKTPSPMHPPMTADQMVALQVGLPHINQHLELLAKDETQKANHKILNARFKGVVSVAQGIQARLARAQRNGGGMPALQRAVAPPSASE